jgi:uncharacterized FAD-dependent dehydrogenase
MGLEFEIKLAPELSYDHNYIRETIIRRHQLNAEEVYSVQVIRRSLDARKKPPVFVLKVKVIFKGEEEIPTNESFQFQYPQLKKRIAVIGFGPAGIFAALQLLENGYLPIVIERGKTVKDRRRDLAEINKSLIVNTESNYCFGEGGAGTYSDGKLYTRSKKRGNVQKVLRTFVEHGATPEIMVNAHPHIGTNKLPGIIENIRETILKHGGIVRFESKLTDFKTVDNRISHIVINGNEELAVDDVILATGHSARDIFNLLNNKNIHIEAKPFALGVRIEHPQSLIDQIQYGLKERGEFLPPASYSLVTQAAGNGVFSFCMCPGGIIAPASTNDHETVVNGWSPSKRNGQFANSGMVVTVNPEHWLKPFGNHALSALNFQADVERKAFDVFNSIHAPAQRVEDFIQSKKSRDLPKCSYLPGIGSSDLSTVLPPFIDRSLREGLVQFGKKMKGYRTNEAVLVGVESRTSSPVRIPRDKEKHNHTQLVNLYPCGEGAGYAGGIMSAALDGMACAEAIHVSYTGI